MAGNLNSGLSYLITTVPLLFFSKKLDRMMAPEMKERRYIPDDPYEKYNKMSFLKHKYSLEKNKKLIEEHGNESHKFDRYRMHRDRLSHYNDLPKEQYLPPGELFWIILVIGSLIRLGSIHVLCKQRTGWFQKLVYFV